MALLQWAYCKRNKKASCPGWSIQQFRQVVLPKPRDPYEALKKWESWDPEQPGAESLEGYSSGGVAAAAAAAATPSGSLLGFGGRSSSQQET